MEERLARLEKAVAQLQAENQCLKLHVADLAARLPAEEAPEDGVESATLKGRWKQQIRRRWPLVAVALTIAVPLVALTVWHLDAFWSTAIGFLNGVLLYYLGPKAWALLVEGLFRAIPGVLFGQATRIALDKFRSRRHRRGA